MTGRPDTYYSVAHELQGLEDAHVLVIGDVMLDRYVYGDVTRVSPEAPVPVLRYHHTRSSLGGAANVAANLASLGVQTTLAGRVGEDIAGEEVRRALEALGIVDALTTRRGMPTTEKLRVVTAGQQIVRVDTEEVGPVSDTERDGIVAVLNAFLARGGRRAIVLADYAKGVLGPDLLRTLIARAVSASVPVVVDPKGRDLSRYAGATVVKPNLAEAKDAAGPMEPTLGPDTADIGRLSARVLQLSQARNVVVSLSADGVVVAGADVPKLTLIPSAAREIADVSGAGDTLVALVAAGLAAGFPLLRSVEIANLAAGAVCAKEGTATVAPTELLSLMSAGGGNDMRLPNPKILDGAAEAAEVGARYRADGRRLVLANGCFDVLHSGHVHLLRTARACGDALLVALNSDSSVRRLKGAGRPVQSELDRCEIMAALACVDFVVLFSEDTPLDLIVRVQPAALVKGDDHVAEDVVGARELSRWGGSLVLVPLVVGRSTTQIIDSQRNATSEA